MSKTASAILICANAPGNFSIVPSVMSVVTGVGRAAALAAICGKSACADVNVSIKFSRRSRQSSGFSTMSARSCKFDIRVADRAVHHRRVGVAVDASPGSWPSALSNESMSSGTSKAASQPSAGEPHDLRTTDHRYIR